MKNKMEVFALRLAPGDIDRITEEAQRRGVRSSEVARSALLEGLQLLEVESDGEHSDLCARVAAKIEESLRTEMAEQIDAAVDRRIKRVLSKHSQSGLRKK
jgi:hypothetical protein